MDTLTPHHIRIGTDETAGNDGRGRVFFLPGSEHRARQIAERFEDVTVHPSPRQLNAYLGVLRAGDRRVDVAALPTGMGCPSLGIVASEVIHLGGRMLLRVGSAGSVQPQVIRAGSLVVATAAVRDEGASDAYCPREVPALAHREWVRALCEGASDQGLAERTWAGTVHTKDSLYGREFATGPMAARNHAYMEMLAALGVLATEMESSHLFLLAASHAGPPTPISTPDARSVKAGCILAIIGDDRPFAPPEVAREAEDRAIDVACAAAFRLVLDQPWPRVS